MSSTDAPREDRKIVCRITEAKNIPHDKGKNCDALAVVSVDKRHDQTPVIYANSNPFWAEEFTFEDIEDEFRQVSFLIKNRQATSQDVGEVLFPRALVTSGQLEEEQWFALTPVDVENSISGDVRIKVVYFPPKAEIKGHSFAVHVGQAKNLVPRKDNGSSDPYVVMHLLPDLRVKSTQSTKAVIDSLEPTFDESFIFVVDDIRRDLELHISVWNKNPLTPAGDIFMGHCSVPLGDAKSGMKCERWYPLTPKPGHIHSLKSLMEKRKSKKGESMTKAKMFALALQTSDLDAAVSSSKTKTPHKFLDLKLASISFCAHCSGTLWAHASHMQCKDCKILAHAKCSRVIANNCGSIPAVRLRIKYSTMPILPSSHYKALLDVCQQLNWTVPTVAGRASSDREEIAKCLVKIFSQSGQAEQMINDIVSSEVNDAANTQTLFRANSMASKAIDVYMKQVGMSYLRQTIGPIINIITLSDKPCEVDPSRLEKKDDVDENWKNLINIMEATVQSLFSSVAIFPDSLRLIFAHLQKEVLSKFKDDDSVKYTSISGFFVLRFIAPAILGPKLFGLMADYADAKASRTFTLIAKSIQNLANLVEFGAKEPFMARMNPVIQNHIGSMKNFLDKISSPTRTVRERTQSMISVSAAPPNLAKECARLFELYRKNTDKIVEVTKESEKSAVAQLMSVLADLSAASDNLSSAPANNSVNIKQSSDSQDAAPAAAFDDQNVSVEEPVAASPRRGTGFNTISNANTRVRTASDVRNMTFNNKNNASLNRMSLNLEQYQAVSSGVYNEITSSATNSVGSLLDEKPTATPEPSRHSLAQNTPIGSEGESATTSDNSILEGIEQTPAPVAIRRPVPQTAKIAEHSNKTYAVSTPPRPNLSVFRTIQDSDASLSAEKGVDAPSVVKTSIETATDSPVAVKRKITLSKEEGGPVRQTATVITLPPKSRPISEALPEISLAQKVTATPKPSITAEKEPSIADIGKPAPLSNEKLANMKINAQPVQAYLNQVPSPDIRVFPAEFPTQDKKATLPVEETKSAPVLDDFDDMLSTLASLNSDIPTKPVETKPTVWTAAKKKTISKSDQQQALMALMEAQNTANNALLEQLPSTESNSPILARLSTSASPTRPHSQSPSRLSPLANDVIPENTPAVPSSGTCYDCEEPIYDSLIDACGKNWHRNHFCCAACGMQLTANYIPYEGLPYCRQDYLQRAGLTCGVCGEYIETEYIEVQDRKYHTACKKCDVCTKQLAGRHYFSLNGKTMCSEHRDTFMNCRACRQPISGQVLVAQANQFQYHPEHFQCSSCYKNLASTTFYERNDAPYCTQCWFKVNIDSLQKRK